MSSHKPIASRPHNSRWASDMVRGSSLAQRKRSGARRRTLNFLLRSLPGWSQTVHS